MIILGVSGCRANVHHDLDERTANDLVVALQEHGVLAGKARDAAGWVVHVPRGQQNEALGVLSGRGLPHVVAPPIPEQASGLVPSEERERARRAAIVAGQLEATLSALEGVRDAHVHLTLPLVRERLGARDTVIEARASVVLVSRPDQTPPPDDVVAAVVTGAIEGLREDQVAVVRSILDVPPPPNATLVSWGPIVVTASSRPLLQRILWGGTALLLTLAALLVAQTLAGVRRGSA